MAELGNLLVFLILLTSGFFLGRRAERSHYTSIFKREKQYRNLVVMSGRVVPAAFQQHDTTLVSGNVVISVDYFKTVVAGLRNLVGGNISAYESLLDRARREAVLRMQEQASSLGAEAIVNLKFETCQVSGNAGQGLGSIEVLAYGTALISSP